MCAHYSENLLWFFIEGRVRKKTKFFHFMDDEGDEDSSKDEEEDVYQPDSEPEEPGIKMTFFSLSETFGFSMGHSDYYYGT